MEHDDDIRRLAAQDGAIAKALATTRPRKIYRAIWWARKLGRLKGDHAQLADKLLADRLSFREALKRTPGLGTLNGVGVSMVDKGGRDPKTDWFEGYRAFVILFIPVFPLEAYVYDRDEKGTYYFQGRVPLTGGQRLWRSVLGLGALAGLGVVGGYGALLANLADVTVTNGLPFAVACQVDDQRVELPPNGVAQLSWVSKSLTTVECSSAADAYQETIDVRLWGWGAVNVINPLGAAAVYEAQVPYMEFEQDVKVPDPTWYCGRSFVPLKPDYAFRELPDEISVDAGKPISWVTSVDVAGGHQDCLSILQDQGDQDAARRLNDATFDPSDYSQVHLRAEILRKTQSAQVSSEAMATLWAQGPNPALGWARIELERFLGSDGFHAELQELLEEEPLDPLYTQLLTQSMPPEQALPLLAAAHEESPTEIDLRLELALTHRALGDDAAAIALWDGLLEEVDDIEALICWQRLQSLARSGELPTVELESCAVNGSYPAAVAWTRQEGEVPAAIKEGWSNGGQKFIRAGAGLSVGRRAPGAVQLMAAFWSAPDTVLPQARSMTTDDLAELSTPSLILAMGLARRAGDESMLTLLSETDWIQGYMPQVLALLAGEPADLHGMAWDDAGAALFAASIQADCPPERAAQLRAQALALEPIPGLLHHLDETLEL